MAAIAMDPRRGRAGLRALESHSQFGQAGMIGRARTRGPEEFALSRRNRHIVDARLAPAHQIVAVELPSFIAVRSAW